MLSWCVKLHSSTDSTKEACRGETKALVKIQIEWESYNGICRGLGWGWMIPAFLLLLFAEMLLFQGELRSADLILRDPLGLQLCLVCTVQEKKLKKTFSTSAVPLHLFGDEMRFMIFLRDPLLTSKCHSAFGEPSCASRLLQLNIGKWPQAAA